MARWYIWKKEPMSEAKMNPLQPIRERFGCTVDPHGNADEGCSTLYLLLLVLLRPIFSCGNFAIVPNSFCRNSVLGKWHPNLWKEMFSRGVQVLGGNSIWGAPEIKFPNKVTSLHRDSVYLFTILTCFQEIIKWTSSVEQRKVMIQKYISTSIKMSQFH